MILTPNGVTYLGIMPIRSKFYVLRGHDVVEADALESAMFFENIGARTVRKTEVVTLDAANACEVSTMFLGIDHNYSENGLPIVFETLVFGGPMADSMRRYATWDESVDGHAETVELVRKALRGEQPDNEMDKKFVRRTWQDRVLDDDD